MSHSPKPPRAPVTQCRALCTTQDRGMLLEPTRCDRNAMPDGELCWTHCHAVENPNRSRPLELVP
jgi:hypothetical protein